MIVSQSSQKYLSYKNDFYPLLKLAIPLILTGIAQSSLSFFQNIFLAHLGENILAAGALVSWLFATLIVILFGTFSSVNILISHQYGANDHDNISLVLRDGLLLAIIFTLPTFLLFWYISPVFLLFGQSPKLVILATLYLHGLAWGLFPKYILIVLFEFFLGLGRSRLIMIVTLLTIPLYIFLSFVLIFGKFGFPNLGIAGAGWGMTIADWMITTILCVLLLLSKKYQPYIYSIFTMKKPSYLGEILHLGLPMGLMYCIEVGFFFAMTLFIGSISIPSLAANQIAMQYLGGLMTVIFCIAQATTVRMGHKLGANEILLAKKTAYTGIILSAIFMSIIAFFYWFTPHLLISVDFNINNPIYFLTVHLATQFLFFAAFFQILESIRIALFGALRSLKDTRFTLLTSMICFWCIALPFGYLLSITLKFGGKGFWIAMIIGASCSVILLYQRFKSKMESYNSVSIK